MKKLMLVSAFLMMISGIKERVHAEIEMQNLELVLFQHLTSEISDWLTRHLKEATLAARLNLRESTIGERTLVKKFNDAVLKTSVEFISENKLLEACQKQDKIACQLVYSTRTCLNSTRPKARIVCSRELYQKRPGDEQLVIAFHEYLGISGIETDLLDDSKQHFSQYPISRHLMKFATPMNSLGIWKLLDQLPAASPSRASAGMAFEDPCIHFSRLYENEVLPVIFLRCSKMNFDQAWVKSQNLQGADVCLAISEDGHYVGVDGFYFYPASDDYGYNSKGEIEEGAGFFLTRLRVKDRKLQAFSAVENETFMEHYGIKKYNGDQHYRYDGKRAYEMNPNDYVAKNESYVYHPSPLYLNIQQKGSYLYHTSTILGLDDTGETSLVKIHLENMKLSLEMVGHKTISIGKIGGLNCIAESPE